MFIMFVTHALLVFFPFLTENVQLKNIMCVGILFTVLFFFFLESILMKTFSSHDWPDDDCIKILSGVRKAMAPHSRVLVRKSHSNFVCVRPWQKKIKFAPSR